MTKIPFHVSIKERPELELFGLVVRTDMTKAFKDCSGLWENIFCPRMPELSGKPLDQPQGESYGLSLMVDMQTGVFDYWAAMPLGPGLPEPEGMSRIMLPAGLYAGCRLNGLEQLSEAYSYLYEQWPASNPGYSFNLEAPCFELYGPSYLQDGSLDIFVPVKKK